MQPQIVEDDWIEVGTAMGIYWIPADVFARDFIDEVKEADELTDEIRAVVLPYTEEYKIDHIDSVAVIHGHGARLFAPGYLDCTEWCVFATRKEAHEYLEKYYPNGE